MTTLLRVILVTAISLWTLFVTTAPFYLYFKEIQTLNANQIMLDKKMMKNANTMIQLATNLNNSISDLKKKKKR